MVPGKGAFTAVLFLGGVFLDKGKSLVCLFSMDDSFGVRSGTRGHICNICSVCSTITSYCFPVRETKYFIFHSPLVAVLLLWK